MADFLEWLANAKPEDEKAIRREIKRYFYDAGDHIAGDELTHALRAAIDAGDDREARQGILNDIEILSRSDPTIVGRYENLFYSVFSFLLPGGSTRGPTGAPKSPSIPKDRIVERPPTESAATAESALRDAPSEVWNLGFTTRGKRIHEIFGDGSLPPLFRTIDKFDFATGEATSSGAYMDVEPVAVEPVVTAKGLHRAFSDAIARKNAFVPNPPKNNWPRSILLKYSGAKTWSAFARDALLWSIDEENGTYSITAHKEHADGYWVRDKNRKTEFPTGTPVGAVIDRMIAILQDAARK